MTSKILATVLIIGLIVIATLGITALGGQLFGARPIMQTAAASCNGALIIIGGCNASTWLDQSQRVDPLMTLAVLCIVAAGVLYLITKMARGGNS